VRNLIPNTNWNSLRSRDAVEVLDLRLCGNAGPCFPQKKQFSFSSTGCTSWQRNKLRLPPRSSTISSHPADGASGCIDSLEVRTPFLQLIGPHDKGSRLKMKSA